MMSVPNRLRSLLVMSITVMPLSAQLPNGGFENGDLTGWNVGGGGFVEAVQAANISPAISPPEGSWFALLSNGPGDLPGAPGGDFDDNGTADFDATTLSVTFTTASPGQTLSFRWAFLTDEVGQDNLTIFLL